MKLDELFLHWLSLGDSRALVLGLLDDAKQGRALKGPHQGPSGGGALSPLSPTSANVLFPSGAVPPLSPTGKAGADLESPKRQRAPQAKLATRSAPTTWCATKTYCMRAISFTTARGVARVLTRPRRSGAM